MKISLDQLKTPKARSALAVRGQPYCVTLVRGVRLAYRRNATGGSWSVIRGQGAGKCAIRQIALADDHMKADGSDVMTFFQAMEEARKLSRVSATEATADAPITVEQAIDNYEEALKNRKGGDVRNARRVRFHLQTLQGLRRKLIGLLTEGDVNGFVQHLKSRVADNTVNRTMRAFNAALNREARISPRQIGNADSWRKAERMEDADASSRNIILSDGLIAAVVREAFVCGHRYGLWIWTLAETGTRLSQARKLRIDDLRIEDRTRPYLQMPASRKGNVKCKPKPPVAVQITPALADLLSAQAAGRKPHDPLLIDDEGNPPSWVGVFDGKTFLAIARKLDLPTDERGRLATPNCLRHSSIVRQILRGVPIRLVAVTHNTSVAQIERTYSKHIAPHGADQLRATLPTLGLPADDVVVPFSKRVAQ